MSCRLCNALARRFSLIKVKFSEIQCKLTWRLSNRIVRQIEQHSVWIPRQSGFEPSGGECQTCVYRASIRRTRQTGEFADGSESRFKCVCVQARRSTVWKLGTLYYSATARFMNNASARGVVKTSREPSEPSESRTCRAAYCSANVRGI